MAGNTDRKKHQIKALLKDNYKKFLILHYKWTNVCYLTDKAMERSSIKHKKMMINTMPLINDLLQT